jgi:hypothetical protein
VSQLQYITEPVTIQAPEPSNGPRGLLLCHFLRFWGRGFGRELLLRYQDKEERAPAALRLRGAGGSAPRLSARDSGPIAGCNGPRQARASAREGRRGRVRPSKARYIIRAGPTGPGPLRGRLAWPHQGGASDKPRAAAGALPDRACAPGAAIGHRLRDNARAAMPPRHRRGLPLHYCAGCASGNPTRRPIGRRRRWRGRGAQRAASKQ